MDVYVLTEDGVPLGAGTDRSVCEDIANRRGETDWTKWVDQSGGGWARSRRWCSSSWSSTQRIVRLPLAGAPHWLTRHAGQGRASGYGAEWDGSSDPITDMAAHRGGSMAWFGYPQVTYTGPTIPTDSPAVDPLSQVYADHVRLADRLNGIWRQRVSDSIAEIEEIGRLFGAP